MAEEVFIQVGICFQSVSVSHVLCCTGVGVRLSTPPREYSSRFERVTGSAVISVAP